MAIKLRDYQIEAVQKLKNGSILCGDTGSGKSLTAIAYYFKICGGDINNGYVPMDDDAVKDLYIITTPQKRDKAEWDKDLANFLISQDKEVNLYHNKVVVDSWNNIHKYIDVENAFFIFDEQRVIGNGAWVKAFLKISKNNLWILLSATPGDNYMDYIPVFIANGFFKNRSDFLRNHVIFNRFLKFPKPEKYINTSYLDVLIQKILVPMNYEHVIFRHIEELHCEYDKDLYFKVLKERWNPIDDKPILNSAEFCKCLRFINNNHESRLQHVMDLYNKHGKIIVFYNFNFELEKLLSLKEKGIVVSQWNSFKHEKIPYNDKWIHVVQYMAGNEGWNCIETNAMVFYSNNYSYRIMKQAAGRIDRMNTPYENLYYYYLLTDSNIEKAIMNSIESKKEFNEKNFSAKFGI